VAEERQKITTSQISPPVIQSSTRSLSAEESRQELEDAIAGSNEVLTTARTTLTLFPDTFTLDRAKLTIAKRSFFRTAEVMSLRIEDVLNVTASVGPLFGRIKIMSRVLSTDQSDTIGRFWRGDAERIKRITQGYVIALQRNIDMSALGTSELAAMLDKLGQDDHPSAPSDK
jgi:hypothetical protein